MTRYELVKPHANDARPLISLGGKNLIPMLPAAVAKKVTLQNPGTRRKLKRFLKESLTLKVIVPRLYLGPEELRH